MSSAGVPSLPVQPAVRRNQPERPPTIEGVVPRTFFICNDFSLATFKDSDA